jgi:small nuclear ribonucleoprotein (snRNP)-like protein
VEAVVHKICKQKPRLHECKNKVVVVVVFEKKRFEGKLTSKNTHMRGHDIRQ